MEDISFEVGARGRNIVLLNLFFVSTSVILNVWCLGKLDSLLAQYSFSYYKFALFPSS